MPMVRAKTLVDPPGSGRQGGGRPGQTVGRLVEGAVPAHGHHHVEAVVGRAVGEPFGVAPPARLRHGQVVVGGEGLGDDHPGPGGHRRRGGVDDQQDAHGGRNARRSSSPAALRHRAEPGAVVGSARRRQPQHEPVARPHRRIDGRGRRLHLLPHPPVPVEQRRLPAVGGEDRRAGRGAPGEAVPALERQVGQGQPGVAEPVVGGGVAVVVPADRLRPVPGQGDRLARQRAPAAGRASGRSPGRGPRRGPGRRGPARPVAGRGTCRRR